jgi:hypothetical protein
MESILPESFWEKIREQGEPDMPFPLYGNSPTQKDNPREKGGHDFQCKRQIQIDQISGDRIQENDGQHDQESYPNDEFFHVFQKPLY